LANFCHLTTNALGNFWKKNKIKIVVQIQLIFPKMWKKIAKIKKVMLTFQNLTLFGGQLIVQLVRFLDSFINVPTRVTPPLVLSM
jgi:predicted nucleic acid-binding protein